MADKIGEAGKSTYAMAEKRRNRAILYAVTGLIVVIVTIAIIMNSRALGLGGGIVLVLFILVNFIPKLVDKKVNQKKREEKRAIRGAWAEEKIDSLLSELGENFVILNDIASPYGNIDHLVISKEGGIFLLETKSHRGQVELSSDNSLLLNGYLPEKDFIAQVLKNSYWVRDQVAAIIGEKPWINAQNESEWGNKAADSPKIPARGIPFFLKTGYFVAGTLTTNPARFVSYSFPETTPHPSPTSRTSPAAPVDQSSLQ